jgi:putative transposase
MTNDDVRAARGEAINLVRGRLPFRIDGGVLLPDHLHTIWTLPEGDADFSRRWRLLERHAALTCPTYSRPELLNHGVSPKARASGRTGSGSI